MREDYIKAKKLGERAYQKAMTTGRYPYLPALDDILEDQSTLSSEPVGLIEIPIELITGTKTAGRQNSFSEGFYPLLDEDSEFATKWSNLYDSQVEEGIREPIKAYEYMMRFYVQEGNKRVSVSQYINAVSVAANVTRILPERTSDPEIQVYYEFLDFYRCVPSYKIHFTEPGSYQKLAELYGETLDHP